jgi:hypothetical protein
VFWLKFINLLHLLRFPDFFLPDSDHNSAYPQVPDLFPNPNPRFRLPITLKNIMKKFISRFSTLRSHPTPEKKETAISEAPSSNHEPEIATRASANMGVHGLPESEVEADQGRRQVRSFLARGADYRPANLPFRSQ